MTVRAVFFDMGGTIETFRWTTELRLKATPGIRKILADAGIDLDVNDIQLFELISAGLAAYHHLSLQTMQELPSYQVWSNYILKDFQVDQRQLTVVAEDLMLYIETHYYERKLRPDVPAVLEVIKQMGLKIGLISNANSRGQVPTNLTEYNLRHYFNPIVLSSEYGRRKPDPAIFHYAARLAQVPTSCCSYVGDRIARDILGARRAGFRLAIQIKHDFIHGESDEGAIPDHIIEGMTELVDILQTELKHTSPYLQSADAIRCPIRALLFDAGDLLYYRAERGKYFREFLEGLGLNPEENHANEKNVLRQKAYRGEIEQTIYHREILSLYGVTQPDQFSRGLRAMRKDEDNVQFFEGVRDTLITLKAQGYLLGIVTDTANPLHTKLSWFERGGFGHVWDVLTSSMEVGVRKPDPRIYRAALEQLGVTFEQAVFLGHKKSELEGARAIGMKTIAFNYDKDAKADYYVEKFSDILKVPLLSLKKEPLSK